VNFVSTKAAGVWLEAEVEAEVQRRVEAAQLQAAEKQQRHLQQKHDRLVLVRASMQDVALRRSMLQAPPAVSSDLVAQHEALVQRRQELLAAITDRNDMDNATPDALVVQLSPEEEQALVDIEE
jgi:hypothetical protein